MKIRTAITSALTLLVLAPSPAGNLAIAITARAKQPGELVVVTITTAKPADHVNARAFDHDVPAFRIDPLTWRALVGIDLDTKPGTYAITASARTAATAETVTQDLVVASHDFPTRRLTVDDAYVNPPAEVAERIAQEAKDLERIWTESAAEPLWRGAFERPVPQESNSAFGTRSVFNGQPRSAHGGADFLSPAGTPIHAPNSGRVALARDLYFSGNTVIIDHGAGLFSTLAHLSVIGVKAGDAVSAGQVVGKVGATGRVTGAHLHWAVRIAGARVDPLSVLAMLDAVGGRAPKVTSTAAQDKVTAGNKIFGLTRLHRIHLSMSAAEWAVLQTSSARNGGGPGGTDYKQADGRLVHVGSGFGGYFPWAHADLRVEASDGKTEFKDVGLRYKGNLSFTRSSAAAPLFANFKLKIDLFGTKGSWNDEKTFNLHAGVVDTSKMRDAIAFAIFRAAGVPAPRTAFVEIFVTVPGVYQDASAGLFTIIEDVNKTFLERVLPPGTGLLMKPEGLRGGVQYMGDAWSAYVPTIRPDRDATTHEQQRVIEFGRLISQTDVALFRSKIGTFLDVDEFLRYVAVNAFIMNTDSYIGGGGHNFYLYLDPADDKFRFIPWDQDLSMGSRNGGGLEMMRPFAGESPLIYWLLDDPAVMERYRAIIKELAASAFTSAELVKMVDAMEPIGTGRGPSPRAYLESRAAVVQQLVASWGGK